MGDQVRGERVCDSRGSRAGGRRGKDPGGEGYGWWVTIATAFSESYNTPGLRVEGFCELVMTVGSDMRGFTCPTSAISPRIRFLWERLRIARPVTD